MPDGTNDPNPGASQDQPAPQQVAPQQAAVPTTMADPTPAMAVGSAELEAMAEHLASIVLAKVRSNLNLTGSAPAASPPAGPIPVHPLLPTPLPPTLPVVPQSAAPLLAQPPWAAAPVTWAPLAPALQTTPTFMFAGPLTNNPAAGAYSSLLIQFPEVENAVLLAIIQHEFKGSELFKLDSKYRDKADRGILEWETEPSVKDYPTLISIHQPLSVYFQVLTAHSSPTRKSAEIAIALISYLATLTKLSTEFEWHAVLAYHMAFFARRRREMALGSYTGWKDIDLKLHAEYLASYRRTRASP